jgi:pyridoxal phosphate enzyme (YggS family)
MTGITDRIKNLQQQLEQAASQCNRNNADIRILAVSKTRSVEEIRRAQSAGLRCFGENYLQEALAKIDQLGHQDFEWHFIGPIQSNKTRDLAAHFDWVQTVDRLKIAQRLSEQRSPSMRALNVCVQINIDNEPQKAGIAPQEALTLCRQISHLPGLKLRGLMAIPMASTEAEKQLASFTATRELFDRLCADGLALDTLSMGMSGDWQAAIRAGSNMIRIGTDIFGPRH